jgi:hypothetical protein
VAGVGAEAEEGPAPDVGRARTWSLSLGDHFHRYVDGRIRRGNAGGGAGSQFLFELDADLDPGGLRDRLDRLLEICPVLGAGLERGGPLPWSAPRWVERPGWRIPMAVVTAAGGESLFDDWFGRPFGSLDEPSFQVVLGRAANGGRSFVLLRWQHALMDAPGCDGLCRLLDGEDPASFRLHDEPPTLWRRACQGKSWLRRFRAYHAVGLRYMAMGLPKAAQMPSKGGAAQRVRFHTFDVQETAALDARAAAMSAGLDNNVFLLAAAALALRRALAPSRWQKLCVPVPINLRPRAWKGPVFANYLGSVLLALPVRRLDTLESAVAAAQAQWRAAIRRGEEMVTVFVMSLARWLPHALMRLVMEGPAGRDAASVYYSSVDLQAGRNGTWLGLPLRRVLVASSVQQPPGLAVAFVRAANKLSVVLPSRGAEPAGVERVEAELLGILRPGDSGSDRGQFR